MSIKRAPRPESNFYMLDKRISEDSRLTWAARGLLVYLLGKPDHWEVSVPHLVGETADSIKQSKRDALYKLLGELETNGYLTRTQGRREKGSFGNAEYIVHEQPHTDNPVTVEPQPDSPYTGLPDTGSPDTANPTQVSIETPASIEGVARTDLTPGENRPACEPLEGDFLDDQEPEPETPEEPPRPRCEIPADMPGPKDPTAKTYRAWANYAMAYRRRYQTWPLWNAKNAGHIGQLISRVGADLAPKVAAYYLTLNQSFYVAKVHALAPLIADCEAVATQMATQRQVTSAQARQADQTQGNLSNAEEAKRLLREKRERERRAANGS